MSPALNDQDRTAVVMAGVPAANATLYHRIRFAVVDPVVYLDVPLEGGGRRSVLILRDIELKRARRYARVD